MGLSDLIAGFIYDALNDDNGNTELQRSELASRFNCVPSQINYVISTRFSPEHGYIVESRRGGNGYIRISRVKYDPQMLIMHTVNSIGTEIDFNSAFALIWNIYSNEIITQKEVNLILASISENALRDLPREIKNKTRANILKQMLINIK